MWPLGHKFCITDPFYGIYSSYKALDYPDIQLYDIKVTRGRSLNLHSNGLQILAYNVGTPYHHVFRFLFLFGASSFKDVFDTLVIPL